MNNNWGTSATLKLAQTLISLPSVTPFDADCQLLLDLYLKRLGFSSDFLRFGAVHNLWAKRGHESPLFVFAGHTDVVPPGPIEQWSSPPFEAHIREGFLYGRGAADMKSSIAAMVMACGRFITQFPNHKGSIAFLITSDEEGPAIDGTRKVVEHLNMRNEKITWCLVGEPSSEHQLGDTIKIGRRGSLNAKLTIYGKQGHIAYPDLADNPIHRSLAALAALAQEQWDLGTDMFSPTCLQFSNIRAGVGATNVIPNQLEVQFNFRYSPGTTEHQLKQRVDAILTRHTLNYDIEWTHAGPPFLTNNQHLVEATKTAIHKIVGIQPTLSTAGGTSDGRFIAPLGCEVLEFGPCNDTIHKIDECIRVDDLERLTQIYEAILVELLT